LFEFVRSAASGPDAGSAAATIWQSVQALGFDEVEHLINLCSFEFDEVELPCIAHAWLQVAMLQDQVASSYPCSAWLTARTAISRC
jgi:hypothetical protein